MSLEKLLRNNYDTINDRVIIPIVIDYVEANETLERANQHHIKRLTKVARNILRTSTRVSDRFLLNTYKHLRRGIEISTEEKLTAHFEAYAGDFATFIFERTKLPQYGLRAYQHSIKAAGLIIESEPEYAASCFFRAGNAAHRMYEKLASYMWLERTYESYLQGAELASSNTLKAEYFERAKNAAKELATKTQNDDWFRKAAYCCEKFLQYAKEKGATQRLRRAAQTVFESGELDYYKYQSGEQGA